MFISILQRRSSIEYFAIIDFTNITTDSFKFKVK